MTGGTVTKSNESSISLLEALLAEQQSTAVDRFARWHEEPVPQHNSNSCETFFHNGENGHAAAVQQSYRELVPLSRPELGQQYAFEVDLDACSGCKSCVAACHSLNGLEEDETRRSVGVMGGGTWRCRSFNTLPLRAITVWNRLVCRVAR